jgi:hypothetical protein
MAYMSQEKKQSIHAALKRVIPTGWKWSLAVRNHSTIVLTIAAAPVDLLGEIRRVCRGATGTHWGVNDHCLDRQFDQTLPLMRLIVAALNYGNHDRSDIQTDYFDVGWYVDINIGRWDRPFVCTAPVTPSVSQAIAAACAARGLPADRLIVSVVH